MNSILYSQPNTIDGSYVYLFGVLKKKIIDKHGSMTPKSNHWKYER